MQRAALLLVLVTLAGCAQYDAERQANLEAAARERAAADDANCRASGLQPGTPPYDDCRRRLQNQHARQTHRQLDLADQMLNAHKLGPIGQ
jgi:hypothetical protein